MVYVLRFTSLPKAVRSLLLSLDLLSRRIVDYLEGEWRLRAAQSESAVRCDTADSRPAVLVLPTIELDVTVASGSHRRPGCLRC
jgi:hypothetical protein